MKRLVGFNILALVGFIALLFAVAGLPGKPLDALAESHSGLYAAVIISSMFLTFYAASFVAMRGRFGDTRRTAALSVLPALGSVALSLLVVYLVIMMNLVSVN